MSEKKAEGDLRKPQHSRASIPTWKASCTRPKRKKETNEEVLGVAQTTPRKWSKVSLKDALPLWSFWVTFMRSTLGIAVIGDVPDGPSFGHLRNILNTCGGDREKAQAILELAISRWGDVRSEFWSAKGPSPTLKAIDAIRESLLPIAMGSVDLKRVVVDPRGVGRGKEVESIGEAIHEDMKKGFDI